MSAIVFSIQSLNNIWKVSIRKCSIGVIRWFSFLNLDRSSFLADVGLHFFYQYRWIIFFFRGWLIFSLPSKWKHAGVGRNTTSVELERKNLADLHYKFYGNTEQKSILYRKKIVLACVCKKNCAMSAEKYQSRLFNDWCWLLFCLFNHWIIFGWCRLGNVRSASPGDFFRPRSLIFAGRCQHTFFSISIGQ